MDILENSGICVVYCTVPQEESEKFSRELLERRLVACVNITPVRSFYRWDGHICDDKEDLLIMKTTNLLLDSLISTIKGMHPYDTPEVIALPITSGYNGYLEWVRNETS